MLAGAVILLIRSCLQIKIKNWSCDLVDKIILAGKNMIKTWWHPSWTMMWMVWRPWICAEKIGKNCCMMNSSYVHARTKMVLVSRLGMQLGSEFGLIAQGNPSGKPVNQDKPWRGKPLYEFWFVVNQRHCVMLFGWLNCSEESKTNRIMSNCVVQ